MESGYHHGALREALVSAAIALLDEGSPLSLRAVARRAGVSHAAPYHHFSDRRALVAAVAEEGLVRLRSCLARAGEVYSEEPGRRLLEVGVAYVRFALEHRPLFRLIFSSELSNREGLPELQAAYAGTWQMLTEMAGELRGPGNDPDSLASFALRGWAMVHGLANLLLDDQVPGVRTVDDAERVARRILLAGAPAAERR